MIVLKVIFLVAVFGFFPAYVVIVATNYSLKTENVLSFHSAYFIDPSGKTGNVGNMADAANGGNIANAGLYQLGGAQILTKDQVDMLQKINSEMLGRWVSLQDKTYVVEYLPNGTFRDTDIGQLVANGTWKIFVSATSTLSKSSSSTAYYLSKIHSESKYNGKDFTYEIARLDDKLSILYYLDGGKLLYFNKEGTETSASSTSDSRSTTNVDAFSSGVTQ